MLQSIRFRAFLVVLCSPLVLLSSSLAESESTAGKVAASAEEARPLGVGDKVPEVTLRTTDGEEFDLAKAVLEKPTVIVFYRGGWCRYCNRHLEDLRETEKSLIEMGYRLVAISPDKPSKAKETVEDKEIGYTVLSDSKMGAAKAFGLAFQLPDDVIDKYINKYKLDLAGYSGADHYQIPVPAAFIIGRDGTIRFRHADADYSTRIDSTTLLAEAKKALEN